MAVIVLTSAKGAPGVTTTAVGLTVRWHRPAILLEADMSGSSSILAGYLRASTTHLNGLVGLGLAHRHHGLATEDLWDQVVNLGPPDKHLVPGIGDPSQSHALTSMWGTLSEVLAATERAGLDVVVDAGRLGTAYAPTPLLRAADLVLLVTGSRLPDLAGAKPRMSALVSDLESAGTGADAARALIVGPGRPYRTSEINTALTTHAFELPWDPDTADLYSIGAPPRSARRAESAPLNRALNVLADQLTQAIAKRRDRLLPQGYTAPTTTLTGGRDDV